MVTATVWAVPQTPTGMQTNGVTNPTLVTTTKPVFHAKYNDSNALASARYYQIQVDKEGSSFASPVWDSGQKAVGNYPPGTPVGSYIPNVQSSNSFAFDGQIYIWRIRLWDTSGTPSSYSNGADTFTMAAPPTAPSDIQPAYGSDVNIRVGWTDNSSDETGFTVQRRDDSGAGFGSYVTIGTTAANVETFYDRDPDNPSSPPVANRRYQYQVLASNAYGNAASSPSSVVYTSPAAPTIAAPTVDSSTAITWAWTRNAAFAESQRLAFSTGATTFVGDLGAGLTSYQTTGLTPNTQYAVQVAAFRTDRGAATSSASAAVYTHANVPGSPASGSPTASALTLTWSADGNPAGTEYYAENVGSGQNSGWITDTSWTSTELECKTTYVLRVKARNGDAVETSPASAASVSTASCPQSSGAPLPPPPPPQTGAGAASVDAGAPVTVKTPEGGTVSVSGFGGTSSGLATVAVEPKPVAEELAKMPPPDALRVVGDLIVAVKASAGVLPIRQFGNPVEVKLTYSDEQLDQVKVAEASVAVFHWHPELQQWVKHSDAAFDAELNTVTLLTDEAGTFALFASSAEPDAQPQAPRPSKPQPAPVVPVRRSAVKLLRAADDQRVYEVTPTGYLRYVPSEQAFLSYGYSWSQVEEVPREELESRPVTTLVKLPGDPKLYWLKDGTKRWISDPDLLEPLGLKPEQVTEVSKIELDSYVTDATVYYPYER